MNFSIVSLLKGNEDGNMKSLSCLDNIFRDSDGRLVLDVLKENIDYELEKEEKGKRAKKWIKFSDGQILIKKIKPSTYEDYAELIVEEMCKQIGLETAHYDLAILDGNPCVITWDFRKKGEKLVSGKIFTSSAVEILTNNGEYIRKKDNDQKELNNLYFIEKSLSIYLTDEEIKEEMSKFDLLFGLNGDIHLSNWSVFYDPRQERSYRLAFNYDAGSYFRYNLSRQNLFKHLRNMLRQSNENNKKKIMEEDIFGKNYVKHNSLNYKYSSTEKLGMSRLEEAFMEQPERFSPVLQKLYEIDSYQIINNVQKRIGTDIPTECSSWFITCVEANQKRIENMVTKAFENYYESKKCRK